MFSNPNPYPTLTLTVTHLSFIVVPCCSREFLMWSHVVFSSTTHAHNLATVVEDILIWTMGLSTVVCFRNTLTHLLTYSDNLRPW